MIIFGTRGYLQVLAMVSFVCNNCHTPAAQRVVQRVMRFTLFFIPLFPISKSYTTTCTFCGFSQKITKDLADQYASHSQQAQGPVGPAREQIPAGAPGGQPGPAPFGQAPFGPSQQYGQAPFGQPQQYGQAQPQYGQAQQYGQPSGQPNGAPGPNAQPGQSQNGSDGHTYDDPSAPQYPQR